MTMLKPTIQEIERVKSITDFCVCKMKFTATNSRQLKRRMMEHRKHCIPYKEIKNDDIITQIQNQPGSIEENFRKFG